MKTNPLENDGTLDAPQVVDEEIDHRMPSDITTGVLWVVIPYTTPELTRTALRHAAVCTDLDVNLCLVDIQVVPFPCPLNQPPINREHSERRLQTLFWESGLHGRAAILYTRDWLEGFRRVLEPGSLVVVATRKRWWRTREEKLARSLTKAGHQVMLLPVVR
jgi:hypothetical protein